MKIECIKLGFCPKCNCQICDFDGNKVKPNNLYAEFWVLFNDGSNSNYAICKKCVETLTMEDALQINRMQRHTWGLEIIENPLSFKAFFMQLNWYISCGALLDVVKFAKTKEEL